MRKPIIAGNWKMNMTIKDAVDFANHINKNLNNDLVESVICAPFTILKDLKATISNSTKLGAQNMHFEDSGAFTGEISAPMLKELNIDYVIIGHSERRQYFLETDEIINKKLKQAFKYDICPILCVGETLEQREQEKTNEIVKQQVINALKDIDSQDVKNMVIAYEPIWAIGTGKTATSEQANEVIKYIRDVVKDLYKSEVCDMIRIQYGGSVKPSNVSSIMEQSDIDGALVGGASLNADDFIKLVNFKGEL